MCCSRRAVAPSTECDTLAVAPAAQARGSERIVLQRLTGHLFCNCSVRHAVVKKHITIQL